MLIHLRSAAPPPLPSPQVWEEVQQWPPLEWGQRMVLPLPVMALEGSLSVQLPELASLPSSCLPAAVAAAGLPPSMAAAMRGAAEGADGSEGGGDDRGSAVAEDGEAVAAAAACLLADELDGDSGLPLCLLPQAYGQQRLATCPHSHVDCFTPLRAALPQLWTLWEILMLGEPLLVVAPTPGGWGGGGGPAAALEGHCSLGLYALSCRR